MVRVLFLFLTPFPVNELNLLFKCKFTIQSNFISKYKLVVIV